jgi:hypothetical protein
MRIRSVNYLLLLAVILMALTCSSCGIRYSVKGQVLDANSAKPIEGAVVAIHWYKVNWLSPLPGTNITRIEWAENVTDKNGFFRIPKRPFRRHDMVVYKKEYICWKDDLIVSFDKMPGSEYMEPQSAALSCIRQAYHKVENGMIIKLEPYKEDITEVQRWSLACFAYHALELWESDKIRKVIEDEGKLCASRYLNDWGK